MLQQTRVDQVIPYFNRFVKRFPSMKSLAAASQEDVLKMWEGLGYYSRARNLHKAAQIIATDHKGRFPNTAGKIIKLPGIGDYTAAAIGSLAFNLDLAVLDGNVIRVLSRLFAYTKDTRSSAAKKELQQLADTLLVKGNAGNYNEAMMELGATVCLPKNPWCNTCPLSTVCLGHESGRPTDYPVKAPKKKVPHIVVGAAVVTNRRRNHPAVHCARVEGRAWHQRRDRRLPRHRQARLQPLYDGNAHLLRQNQVRPPPSLALPGLPLGRNFLPPQGSLFQGRPVYYR